ncbi:hypothetical protein J8F10_30125 [Gemmata sp. G18]|uniref:DUF4065 domain-containing protein n=1 Tax=Gemmata palustris TaxID=2822762 RepID=A0ABS5C0T7_9BACT|nr:hypothetical protein [Gemmata palustris]MBP3959523.1 hypothetical protein [Gemmata palustris]
MTEIQKDAVLLSLLHALKERGSWCGETHVQKATFIFQEMLGVPLGFNFVLYKHGPYSFDLKNELTAQLADGLLAVVPRPPYGPGLHLGGNSETFLRQYPKTRAAYRPQTEFVAAQLGSKGIAELERLATAVFLTLREPDRKTSADRAARLHELKPHIPLDAAHTAVAEADALIAAARAVAPSPTTDVCTTPSA